MSDFAKFIPQKEVVYLLNLIIHMAAIECKVAMCISRLVKFELLLELQDSGYGANIGANFGVVFVKGYISRRVPSITVFDILPI
jgi:hypothetical protein